MTGYNGPVQKLETKIYENEKYSKIQCKKRLSNVCDCVHAWPRRLTWAGFHVSMLGT